MFGRFLQTDPIGSKDDLDLYAYTADDPIDHADPTGNQAVQAAAACAAGSEVGCVGPAALAAAATCAASSGCRHGVADIASAVVHAGVRLVGDMISAQMSGETRDETTAGQKAIDSADESTQRGRINVDANVLINILDKPASNPFNQSATAAVGSNIMLVSPAALQEYNNGGAKSNPAGLSELFASGNAQLIPGAPFSPDKHVNDANIVSAGIAQGAQTLTNDGRMHNQSPPGTVILY